MIAGLNRDARRKGLFLSALVFVIIGGWAFAAWSMRSVDEASLATTLVWAPVILWLGYLAVRTLRLVRPGQPSVFVADGKLHAHQLMSFWAVPLSDIRSVEKAEIVSRFGRYPGVRIHLVSGGAKDIPVKSLNMVDDELVRRINEVRPIW